MKPYKKIEKLLLQLPEWAFVKQVTNSTGRTSTEVKTLIKNNIVRARRIPSKVSSTGTTVVVYVKDVLYVIHAQSNASTILDLVARGEAPVECDRFSGIETGEFLIKRKQLTPKSINGNPMHAIRSELGEIPVDIIEMFESRINALETGFGTILGFFGGAYKGNRLTDSEIEILLSSASKFVISSSIKISDVHKWLKEFRKLSSEHFSEISQWGRANKARASLYVSDVHPTYTPLMQVALKLRNITKSWAGQSTEGTRLVALKAAANVEFKRINELGLGQNIMDIALKTSFEKAPPIGHIPTDVFILQFISNKIERDARLNNVIY